MGIDIDTLLEIARGETEPEQLATIEQALQSADPTELPEPVKADDEESLADKAKAEKKQTDVRTMLNGMTMAQKIKTAMLGNALVRRILIFDPSKLIQECVLNNPRLGIGELEEFARNPNLGGQVLRSISSRSTWMRSYKLKANMVMNPKCPPDLSLRWLRYLHDTEVKMIAQSKNVPQVLQLAARKQLEK